MQILQTIAHKEMPNLAECWYGTGNESEMWAQNYVFALRECLKELSNEHREVIDLVYYHEKSVEEVAAIVGIPEATVKTRMFYARKKLSELLKERGIDRGWP